MLYFYSSCSILHDFFFFFFKQKTAYEIDCDWSSDVCSSDLDKNQETIDKLANGIMPFIEEGIHELKKHIGKTFHPTSSYEVINKSHIIILTLGTQIGRASCRERV